MESNEDIYNTICRVCLSYKNKESMVPLVANGSDSEDELSCYGKAVTTFANIVLKLDSLPNKMCQNCLFLLKQAIIFKKNCENSNETLMRLVRNVGDCDVQIKEAVTEYVMYLHCFGDISDLDNTENGKSNINHTEMTYLVEKPKTNIKDAENSFMNEFESDHLDSGNADWIKDCTSESEDNHTNSKEHEKKADNLLSGMEKLLQMDVTSVNKIIKEHNEKNIPKQEKQVRYKKTMGKKEKPILQETPKVQQRDIPCKFCNKVLANINTFKSHMQLHTGRRHVCETCGKGFSGKAELLYHQAAVHKYGRMYACNQCDYKAPRKIDLVEHERIHTGERPFACEECGLTFRRQYHWRKHTLLHKEKTVKCLQCPRMFYLKGDMMAHYNNVHDRIYVYACHVCGVTYAKTCTVRRHLTERHSIPRQRQGKIKRIMLGAAPKIGKDFIL